MRGDQRQKDHLIQVYVKEYEALAAEIQSHFSSMRFFVALNLTVFAAILGASMSLQREDHFGVFFTTPEMLLIVPIFSFLIGSLIYFHSRRISQIGLYFRDILRPMLQTAVGANDQEKVLGWERFLRNLEQQRWWAIRWLSLSGLSILTCAGTCSVSLVAFAWAIFPLWQGPGGMLAAVEAVLLIWLILLVVFERQSWQGRQDSRASAPGQK